MALDKKIAEEASKETPANDQDTDLKIAVLLGMRLLDDGGFDVIDKAVDSSKDPGQVIGQFLMQMGQQMYESMPDDLKFSPEIMLEDNGWLEQISDYIQVELGVDKKVMDKAEIYVANTATQMAQAKAAPAAAQAAEAPPGAPPAMPQGAM